MITQQPHSKPSATLTVKLPNGQALTLSLATAARRVFNLATYPVTISAGYLLFGWRGAALAGALTIVRPLRERTRQGSY